MVSLSEALEDRVYLGKYGIRARLVASVPRGTETYLYSTSVSERDLVKAAGWKKPTEASQDGVFSVHGPQGRS